MSAKGQIFSIDFLVACTIFLITVTILYVYWGYTTIQIEETRFTNDMTDKLNLASQVWFKEGTPIYWDSSNVIELGLQNNHEFNETKMNNLNSIGYQRVMTLVGILSYNFYYRLYDENNSTLFEFGLTPSNSKNLVRSKRVGILNGSIAFLEVVLWSI